MPNVGSGYLYVDQALTQISIQTGQNLGYVAGRAFPIVSARTRTGKVFRIDNAEEQRRQFDTARAPGAEANLFDLTTDTSTTYTCEDHALRGYVTDEERAQAEAPVSGAINKIRQLTKSLLLDQEIKWAAAISTAKSASAEWTGTGADTHTYWDNYTNGDPITNLNTGITTVKNSAGIKPNVLAFDEQILRVLMHHPDFQDRAKYTTPPSGVTRNTDVAAMLLAQMLSIDEVLYAEVGLKKTTLKGQSATLATILGENAYLMYRDPNPGFETPSAGVTVTWNTANAGVGGVNAGGVGGGFRTETWREAVRASDGVMVHRYYDIKVLKAGAIYWFANTLT